MYSDLPFVHRYRALLYSFCTPTTFYFVVVEGGFFILKPWISFLVDCGTSWTSYFAVESNAIKVNEHLKMQGLQI